MFEPVALDVRRRPSLVSGLEITDFASPDTELICPYFHQRFFAADSRSFICQGTFDGAHEAVLVRMEEAKAWRLTDGGANVHTADLAPDSRTLYFTRDQALWSVDVETGAEARLRDLPAEDGYTCLRCVHRNADGSLIAAAANREHASGVREGRVWAIPIDGGPARAIVDRPFQIGHVQFSTNDPGLVMYCHETGGSSPQRIWLARVDGKHSGALFDDPGHPWVTHETFTRNGEWVVFVRHPDGMGMIRPDNTDYRALDAQRAWHPGPTSDASAIIHDTHTGEIRLLLPNEDMRLVKLSESELVPGGPHPHPCFAPDDRTAIWTSSGSGKACASVIDVSGVI